MLPFDVTSPSLQEDTLNRHQDLELIVGLILDLKPDGRERQAIVYSLDGRSTVSGGALQVVDTPEDTMRLARELATPILWSDVQLTNRKALADVGAIAFQADEWSLAWEVMQDVIPYEPVATLCLPSTMSDDRARPLTFYDLWRSFRSYDELMRVSHDFACFENAFWRKCGQKLFPQTLVVYATEGWLWKKQLKRVVRERMELGDGVERYAREKIRERFGWYSPNDIR